MRFAAHRPELANEDSVEGEILSGKGSATGSPRESSLRESYINRLLKFPGSLANRLRQRNFFFIDADISISTIVVRALATLCFCFLLGYVAYVLYGIAINL